MYVGLLLLLSLMLSEIFMGIYLSKKYDPYFPDFVNSKVAFENGFWFLSPIARGLRYGSCIFFKNASTKRIYCHYFFKGFDFRARATFFDKLLVGWCMGSFCSLGVVSSISLIFGWV
jgi:hypothetical protein